MLMTVSTAESRTHFIPEKSGVYNKKKITPTRFYYFISQEDKFVMN